MANRDLLADAIADAKAVKEVAIANAKAALEEAFTPHLKDMLAQKINEMEDMDEEMDLAEVDKEKMDEEKEMDEGYGKKDMEEGEDMDEGYGKKDMDEAEDMDEELDLEEILAELELDEEKELEEETSEPHGNIGAQTPEGEPLGFLEEEEAEEVEAEEEVETDDSEEEINLEEMSEEELKDMIEDVIEDMISAGELEAGGDKVEMADEEGEAEEGEAEEVDMEMDVDADLQEGKEEVNELDLSGSVEALPDVAAMVAFLAGALGVPAAALASMSLSDLKGLLKGKKMEEGEKEAMEETIQTLRSDLNEVNLLNSKLLYTNKIFRGKNLTENQKIKVLKAFDKAETVKEAKAIFETLNENLVAKTAKSNIRESLGAASKPAGVAPKRNLNEGIVQEDAMVNRFKQLAGIK